MLARSAKKVSNSLNITLAFESLTFQSTPLPQSFFPRSIGRRRYKGEIDNARCNGKRHLWMILLSLASLSLETNSSGGIINPVFLQHDLSVMQLVGWWTHLCRKLIMSFTESGRSVFPCGRYQRLNERGIKLYFTMLNQFRWIEARKTFFMILMAVSLHARPCSCIWRLSAGCCCRTLIWAPQWMVQRALPSRPVLFSGTDSKWCACWTTDVQSCNKL